MECALDKLQIFNVTIFLIKTNEPNIKITINDNQNMNKIWQNRNPLKKIQQCRINSKQKKKKKGFKIKKKKSKSDGGL